MNKEEYQKLLEKVPRHDSPVFIKWLRENNKVVKENDYYIIIENIKYHTIDNPFYTIFSKDHPDSDYAILNILTVKFAKWEWLKKDATKQTINRFHVHVYRSYKIIDTNGNIK